MTKKIRTGIVAATATKIKSAKQAPTKPEKAKIANRDRATAAEPLGYSVTDPNFSIVLPGGCNAKCSFCFEGACTSGSDKDMKTYLNQLNGTLSTLPPNFTSISITGGEPTLSRYFVPVLALLSLHKESFKKVVLTTNGTNLLKHKDAVVGVVDHINLSFHHHDEGENLRVFGGKYNLQHADIRQINSEMSRLGIDVTANCVFNPKHSSGFFMQFIETAKSLGFSAIHFRKENGNNVVPKNWKAAFGDYTVTGRGGCPVCMTTWIRVDGMPVALKTSVLEPDTALKADTIHEMIFRGDCELYSDWAAKRRLFMLDRRVFDLNALVKCYGSLADATSEIEDDADFFEDHETSLSRMQKAAATSARNGKVKHKKPKPVVRLSRRPVIVDGSGCGKVHRGCGGSSFRSGCGGGRGCGGR